jgi:hypothetical protein
MRRYLLQTICDYYLEVRYRWVNGIKKYRACYQERHKFAWHPIAGSRWEVKRADAQKFLDRYARSMGIVKPEKEY